MSSPLRYFIGAVLAYLAATVGMGAFGDDLTGSVWHPHLLGLTHLLTLGTIVGMIMGATYQLVPVVLLVSIWSQGLGKVSFWCYFTGLIALIGGFWAMSPPWLGIGATLTAAKPKRPGASSWDWLAESRPSSALAGKPGDEVTHGTCEILGLAQD